MIYLLYRMQDDRFFETAFLFIPDLYQQLRLQEFSYSLIDNLLRNFRQLMNLLRRIGLLTIIEALAYQMHHHATNPDALRQLQMVVPEITIVIMDVLIGMTEQCTKDHDSPGYLKPQQKKRNGCQRTVDDIIAGKKYLQIDVAILQGCHADTRQE